MTIEHDDLDKDWDARSHTPEEYRREIRDLRDRCIGYTQELDRLRKQTDRAAMTADYRPWRSVHDDPPPCNVPVLVAVSLLGRDDFVFAAGVMYRKPNGAYTDGQGQLIAAAMRPEFWLTLDGLEGLRHHEKEATP